MPVTETGLIELVEVEADVLNVVASTTEVELVTIGIQGPPGPPGPPTPGATYIWDQGSPSTTWNIAHNLGQFPSVTIVDSARSLVIGQVQYIDSNTLTVTLTVALSGFAFLN